MALIEPSLMLTGDHRRGIWKPAQCKRFSICLKSLPTLPENGVHILQASPMLTVLSEDQALHFHLYTDAAKEPFVVESPSMEKAEEFLLTYNGYHLKLYADGVLFDEEFPFGDICEDRLDVELHEAAIVTISDDAPEQNAVEATYAPSLKKTTEILGDLPTHMQYFKPLGHKAYAGDCIPYYHDGVFHLYYLFDRRNHRSKKGFGAHQWAHVSTTDLIHWTHHPIALGITDETEGSICTGSVIEKDGLLYAFYAKRDTVERREKLTYAVSDTPNYFEKTNKFIYEFQCPPYVSGPARDPYVYRDHSDSNLYHMLVTTRREDPINGNKGGCLARLTSSDLKNWQAAEPFFPGYNDDPECSDYFQWNDWYYLIFSNEGVAKYRMSRHSQGPWLAPEIDVFDAPCLRVMKTAAFHGNRRIGAGFLEKIFCHFGGNIVFRELVQNEDGTLGTTFVPELMPACKREISIPADTFEIMANEGFSSVRLDDMPRNYRITAEVTASGRFIGVSVRNQYSYADGHECKMDLVQKTAQIRKTSDGYVKDNNKNTIFCPVQETFRLSITVYDDIMDIYIGGQRTLCGRIDGTEGNAAYLYVHNARAHYKNIRVEEI